MSFQEHVKKEILKNGPMRLDIFFAKATNHYYSNQNPFGKSGDFITAPMVSQLFGEMIAFWIIQKSQTLESFSLVELGAGNGQMMADIMRIIRSHFDTNQKLENIHLVEFSEKLRGQQQFNINDKRLNWHYDIAEIKSQNTIIIANEFFDALPFRQFLIKDRAQEAFVIMIDDRIDIEFRDIDEPNLPKARGIYEISYDSQNICRKIDQLIGGGAALIIDYGYFKQPQISTLQALKNHAKVDPLANAGEADITYHVDFLSLAHCFANRQINLMTQADFLLNMGIELRAQKLIAAGANHKQIQNDLMRLTYPDKMGTMFKVMEVCSH